MEEITTLDFDNVYSLFEESFPQAELRAYQLVKDLYEKDVIKIYKLEKDILLQGAMIVWELSSHYIYIENFAINKTLRGSGLGSVMLDDIKKKYLGYQFILEVEVPYDEMSERRISFYQRNQFIINQYQFIQPSLRSVNENTNIHLLFMTYPTSLENEYDFDIIKKQIFQTVYKQTV